jgi:hypothetical protein
MDMVLHAYHDFCKSLTPDGSYHEGASYWAYTTLHLARIVEVMARKRGLNLYDAANYVGMMEYGLAMQMPHRDSPNACVNFGDCGRRLGSDIAFWAARRSRDGLAQHIGLDHAYGHSIYSLIWHDPSVQPVAPTEREHFKHLDLDWMVLRTGYEPDDLVVAMRSGGPSNHEHADRNSVVLKCYDEVLLADVKHPPYSYQDPCWILRTSPSHNTVLVDGKGHQYHDGHEGTNPSSASAGIVRTGDRGRVRFWASDATPAYALVNEDIASVTRTVAVLPAFPCVLVLDKLIKRTEPSTFAARWHIENEDREGKGVVDGDAFTILRPGARFVARCAGSGRVTVVSDTIPIPEMKEPAGDPPRKTRFPKEATFPYVAVSLNEKAQESLLITAGCPVKGEDKAPDIDIAETGGVWDIAIRKADERVRIKVLDDGSLPKFEIVEISD